MSFTPRITLVITVSALDGDIIEDGSVRVKVPSELNVIGSARVALRGGVTEAGSIRTALPSESTSPASIRVS